MLEYLLKPEIQTLIQEKKFFRLREVLADWTPPEVAALIGTLPRGDDAILFRILPRDLAHDTFEYLSSDKQHELLEVMAREQGRLASLLNDLSPDDRTALLEELPGPVAQKLLVLLSPEERRITVNLLGYPEDSIGRLMTTEYVAVRTDWSVQAALEHIRRFGRDSETLNVIYVVDEQWHLLDDLSIRQILLADPGIRISELMDRRYTALTATDDQETAIQVFRDYDRVALPVTDTRGVLLGIVTVDDVLDVAQEEFTEDIHKMGGSEALDAPYLSVSFWTLVKKRSFWLMILFIGEMFTISAMDIFEEEIAKAVVLAVFVPLIISSGGNTGSQAATIIIRAMALGELTLRDWWKVMRREILSGLTMGAVLGSIGFARVAIWQELFGIYGQHWPLIGLTVALSLLGVVVWGTLSGSMLPFILQRIKLDPAASSAPLVATLVDVTGLVIYFSVAVFLLSGTLL